MNPQRYLTIGAAVLAAVSLSFAQERGQREQVELKRVKESELDQQKLTANNLMGKKLVDRDGKSIGEIKDIGLGAALVRDPVQQTAQSQSGRRGTTESGGMTGRAGEAGSQAGQVELYVELDDSLNVEGDALAVVPVSKVRYDRQTEQLKLQVARDEFTSQLRQSGSQSARTQTGQRSGQSATDQSRQQSGSQTGTGAGDETLTPTGVVVVEHYTLRPIDTESMVPLAQLPEAVRRGVEREAPGREIADIDREESNGRIVYEVEFRDSGVNPRLHFNQDGTLATGGADVSDRVANFFAGTQITDTPRAVQDAIRRETASGRVTDVDIERRTGQTVYEVEIEDSRGTYEVHIDVNGNVLRNERRVTP